MGDIMRPLPFDRLVEWALAEHRRHGSVFGLPTQHHFRPTGRTVRDPFGHHLATPVGPAAGPHTQLAPNIVVSYLAGARFVELKTVQVVDGDAMRAAVPKPCIDAEDEGFNCEWSTELTVEQAFAEYVHAHLAIRVLAVELGLGDGDDVAFDASVGYDLAGIRDPRVDGFVEGLRDASPTPAYRGAMTWLERNLGRFARFDRGHLERITPRICDSMTISTMHGCPADEIERIADHLLDKGLHTVVKCNPTMLGYDLARTTLDDLGYSHLAFDDHHFTEDLQYEDAVPMFDRLREKADAAGLVFGLKLSNTLPNDVTRGELPASEMYLSGRALLPLTLALAAKLSRAFDGRLPISYAGGADATNVAAILRTGIQPVTVATTLLKPGGYARMRPAGGAVDARSWPTTTASTSMPSTRWPPGSPRTQRTHKRHREKVGSRKTRSPLPLTDCFTAPCEHGGCPIEQQVPDYLALAAAGRHADAFRVIVRDNTAPTITGVLCSEPCRRALHAARLRRGHRHPRREARCRRRRAGRRSSRQPRRHRSSDGGARRRHRCRPGGHRRRDVPAPQRHRRSRSSRSWTAPTASCGGSSPPSGSPASRSTVTTASPWRPAWSSTSAADPDYDLAELRTPVRPRRGRDGLWGRGPSPVARAAREQVVDALDFLWEAQTAAAPRAGRRVAVIGAGDVAMDCARTALRTAGVEHVALVYRRTEPFMPAAQEDVNAVRAEGIEMLELLAPISYDGCRPALRAHGAGALDAADGRVHPGHRQRSWTWPSTP